MIVRVALLLPTDDGLNVTVIAQVCDAAKGALHEFVMIKSEAFWPVTVTDYSARSMAPMFMIVTVPVEFKSLKLRAMGLMLIAGDKAAACDSLLLESRTVTS